MTRFWSFVYNLIGIPLLYATYRFVAFFNDKVKHGLRGRIHLFEELERQVKDLPQGPRFWIHNSSMGEFEQAKPIIPLIKTTIPDASVIVTFYSPSGLEHIHENYHADLICYLPFDTRRNARRFLNLIKPDACVVVRHDIWPNHIYEARRRNIPTVLINCSVRPHFFYLFPLTRQVVKYVYGGFDEIQTVSRSAKRYMLKHGLTEKRIRVVGDTRYDQVIRRAEEAESVVSSLRSLKKDRRGFVAGSTWPSDETVIFEALRELVQKGYSLWTVLVPHEPIPERLDCIESQLREMGLKSVRLSEVEERGAREHDVLMIDRIGMLASLYALGDLTFVGGGFGPGVHNVLEPAALKKVVFFGPRSTNSYEAGQLKKRGVGFLVEDGSSLSVLMKSFLDDKDSAFDLGKKAARLVEENRGATDRVVTYLEHMVRKDD